jgi:hypothetical protein
VLSVQFDWKGQRKPVTTLLIGTSPEFELALYTLCFVAGGRYVDMSQSSGCFVCKGAGSLADCIWTGKERASGSVLLYGAFVCHACMSRVEAFLLHLFACSCEQLGCCIGGVRITDVAHYKCWRYNCIAVDAASPTLLLLRGGCRR